MADPDFEAFRQSIQGAGSVLNAPGAFSPNGRPTYGRTPTGADTVWLGQTTYSPISPGQAAAGEKYGTGRGYAEKKTLVPFQEAVLAPMQWDDKTMREFVNKGIVNKVPGFDGNMGLPEIMSAWHDMLQTAWGASTPDKTISPWDVLNSYANNEGKFGTKKVGDWVIDLATGERLKYVGPTKRTRTQKSVNLSSPEDVKALTTQMLRELLGRAPNDKELAQFRASINSQERATPEVTTITEELKPDLATGQVDVVSQSSVTSGGVSEAARGMLVQESVEDNPEYGKYQAGTTYFNALMQMIAGG